MSSSRLQRTAAAALSCALLLALTGCGDDETTADLDPTKAPSSTHTPSASPTPTADPSAWTSDYTDAEIKAFDAALRRFDAYEKASEPIWAAGKATPAAKKIFKEYFPSPVWEGMYRKLEAYEQAEGQLAGLPDVLWSWPEQLNSSNLKVRQCVDYGPTKTTQYGKPATPVQARLKPVLRVINLSKPAGYDWLIYGLDETPGEGDEDIPCDPTQPE